MNENNRKDDSGYGRSEQEDSRVLACTNCGKEYKASPSDSEDGYCKDCAGNH